MEKTKGRVSTKSVVKKETTHSEIWLNPKWLRDIFILGADISILLN